MKVKFKSTYGKYTSPNTYELKEDIAKKVVDAGFAEYAPDTTILANKEIVSLNKKLDNTESENKKLLDENKDLLERVTLLESKYRESQEKLEELNDELHSLKSKD